METISILIPTFNAENYIRPLITSLKNQEIDENQHIEIIIIDSTSTDDTVNIIKSEFSDVEIEVISNQYFDHGGTRNLLASKAQGQYLLFMTQDAIPYDNFFVRNLLTPIRSKDVVISYARQLPKENAKPLEKFARNFNYPEQSFVKNSSRINELGIKTFFNSNVSSMYKREFFHSFGGFPEKIILNEDMILASKAVLNGFNISYTSEAKVYHSHNYSLIQQFKRYFDIGMAFNETKYLLDYASNEQEGARMIVNQMRFLIANRNIQWIPYALVENIFKFIGYNLGKRHTSIPYNFKRIFSAYMK
ncbi:glycosyltransferase [Mesobacillus subterraneus]|uniref:glycosyltransferase family 2 protein n=1 Tax=Mesobacillus subterraneus TaxID=285983 RepID=UPI00203EC82C|nr:glycosyltransferase [Mesobacillus subterraneus]MCM3574410.1 glycosyltransferase [Mesobacillus subterraneus]